MLALQHGCNLAALDCPVCGKGHLDAFGLASEPHHVHECTEAHCGGRWEVPEAVQGNPLAKLSLELVDGKLIRLGWH